MPRLTLLARFSLISLALFAIIGALLGYVLTEHFRSQAIEQHAFEVKDLVVPLVGPYLDNKTIYWKGAVTDTDYRPIEIALSHIGGSGLVRVKIWNSKGMIIYSDDRALVGQSFPVEGKLAEALKGNTSADIDQPDKAENIAERGFGTLLEVYTPLYLSGHTETPVGAFEGYYDVEELMARINQTNGYMWASIIAGFLVLYVSLFTLVRNASQRLLRQSRENALLLADTERKAARLQLLNDLARSINRSTLGLGDVFQTALRGIERIVGPSGARITVLNEETGEALRTVGSLPQDLSEDGVDQQTTSLKQRLLGDSDTFICADTRSGDPQLAPLARRGVASVLLAWIRLGDRRLGILDVAGASPDAFDQDDADIIKGVADQLAVAIENSRLIKETAENTALRETNRLKDEFVSMVSHEFRTPLASIKGYARTLLASDAKWDEETRQEFTTIISEESDKLGELVENLLEMSRIEAGRVPVMPEPMLMHHFCREVVNRVAKQFPDVHFECALAENLPMVEADPRRVEQVLVNLLQNAAKYSHADIVRVRATYDGGREITVRVEDKGVGIAPEHLPHLFSKFYRIERKDDTGETGTGLGLAIARALVEAQGGRIWVESKRGEGTTFYFTLPVLPLAEESPNPVESETGVPQ